MNLAFIHRIPLSRYSIDVILRRRYPQNKVDITLKKYSFSSCFTRGTGSSSVFSLCGGNYYDISGLDLLQVTQYRHTSVLCRHQNSE